MSEASTALSLLASRSHADATMLVHCETPISFARVLDEARRVAGGLVRLGVRPGDRVAIWLPTTPAWIATFFACAQVGAIAVAVNTRFVPRELADIVGRSGAKVLVFWPGFAKVDFAAILAGCDAAAMPGLESVVVYGEPDDVPRALPAAWRTLTYDALAGGAALDEERATPDTPCAIFTTSGTTKAPKFVLHDQKTLVRHGQDVVEGFGLHPASTMLLAPPMCGVFGFCSMMAALAAGRPMITAPTWDPAQAARWIDRYRVTHVNATDDALMQLLAQNDRTPAFPTLEFCGYAAFNPALSDVVERAQRRGLALVGLYGISEIQALFARQPEHAPVPDRAPGGGRPVSALARVRARDPESGRLQPHGESGELEFLAPSSRMVGYFGNPDATAAATTDDGWYRSGDLGYTLADGRFVYLTRMGDSMRLGGFLVSPAEIEGVVQECEGIDGCQVVAASAGGVPRPVAFVRLVPGARLDEAGVIAHCAARLARYKVPLRVFPIDAFPVTEGTNATKIQKHKLRDLAQARLDETPLSGDHR
ncbi:MAG: AMP-binding protein [Burkholderiaceae bacterium]